ncbi:MAG: FtsB family cell division protein [Pseudonocardiaceae bacterium]
MRGGAGGDPASRRRAGAPRPGVPARAAGVPRPFGVRIGHAFGVTSPRRAAMLALVVCALALSVAVPLRNYVSQRNELTAVHEQQGILADQVAELERRRVLLEDPRHIEAQARERLRYVKPGQTPYVVQLPTDASEPSTVDQHLEDPWFTRLWESIVGG